MVRLSLWLDRAVEGGGITVVTFDALLGTIARYVERMLGASQDGYKPLK
ncbi:MAG: hypothetical protein ACTHNZ_12260 [Trinickia sp.]